jgi:hypothetical protein
MRGLLNLLPHGAETGRLQEHHRVRVADGGDEQALGVVGGGGDHHLQAAHVGEQRLHALGVVLRGADAPAVRGAQHHGHGQRAAAAVAQARRVVGQLVEGGVGETAELDLYHRLQAPDGHADGRAHDPAL